MGIDIVRIKRYSVHKIHDIIMTRSGENKEVKMTTKMTTNIKQFDNSITLCKSVRIKMIMEDERDSLRIYTAYCLKNSETISVEIKWIITVIATAFCSFVLTPKINHNS